MQKAHAPSTYVRCRHAAFRDRLADRVLTHRSFHRSSHRPSDQVAQDSSPKSPSSGPRLPRRQNPPISTQQAFDRLSRDSKPFFRFTPQQPPENNLSRALKSARPKTVDVRSLAASLPDVQQRLVIRKVEAEPRAPKARARKSEIFRKVNVPTPSSRGPSIRTTLGETRNRRDGPSMGGGGARRSADPKFRSRKPAASGAHRRSVRFEEMTTSAALKGMKSRKDFLRAMNERKEFESAVYQSPVLTSESLHGNGPAIPLAEWGMTEVVEEWVNNIAKAGTRRREVTEQMAEKWKRGEFVPFGSKEMKADVLNAVENGIGEMSDDDRAAAAEKLRQTFGKDFAERVFKGSYVFNGSGNDNVLELLARDTTRNGSFLPKDSESLVGKVKTILPPGSLGGSQKAASP